MRVNKTIDYIQYSAPAQAFDRYEEPDVIRSPVQFYRKALKYQDGTIVCTGNPNTDNVLVIMSGKVCNFYQPEIETIMRVALANGAKFSRIDLAVTVDRSDVREMFAEAIRRDMWVSRRFQDDEPKVICDKEFTVQTYYLGDFDKRSKKGMFRMYDKGLELGIPFDLTRFELECRRGVAHSNAKRYVEGVDIGNMIRKSVDLPKIDWWVEMMGDNEPLPQLPEVDEPDETDVWKWLMKQVAPALGKALAKDRANGGAQEQAFWDKVQAHHDDYCKRNL